MTSAAKKAAKALKGSSRNRPSLSMSQAQINPSASVGDLLSEENLGESANYGSITTGGPLFMDDLQSQYESLSEKLAREENTMNSSNYDPSSSGYQETKSSGFSSSGGSKSRKVRWAETAAVASTLDAENAAASDYDDPDRYDRSPMDIISDLFQRKYTLPIFLVMTSAIFLLVHMTGGGDEKYKRFDSVEKVGLSSSGGGGGRFNRLKNLEGGAGFGETTFSLSPSSDMLGSIGPTSEAIAHTTPKVPAPSPADATSDGNAEDWVIVPTQSGVFGSDTGTATDGAPTNLLWQFPPG